jgi:hypothetical protein
MTARWIRTSLAALVLWGAALAPAQQEPAVPEPVEETYRQTEAAVEGRSWGWIGLIGLFGLFGLRGAGARRGRSDVDVRRAA